MQKPHRHKAEPDTPEALAVRPWPTARRALETAEIAATDDDSVMLIDAYSWFVSDMSNISQRVQGAAGGRVQVDPSRSYMKSVKGFPGERRHHRVPYLRQPEHPGGPRTVPDTRYIPVSIHYDLAKLPEQPMEPRMGDDRTGFFLTVHKDFTTEDKTFFKRYVNRWRLECDGAPGSDGLCTPKEPIIYYIDHTVPEEFREAMMEGVQALVLMPMRLPVSATPCSLKCCPKAWIRRTSATPPCAGALPTSRVTVPSVPPSSIPAPGRSWTPTFSSKPT
ncbi:MAG: DUF5117 domain-containing protein [Balneolaceae bacterium]|nr:DUF5117 domain-containing protein [Balneolaceae bacterium]